MDFQIIPKPLQQTLREKKAIQIHFMFFPGAQQNCYHNNGGEKKKKNDCWCLALAASIPPTFYQTNKTFSFLVSFKTEMELFVAIAVSEY